MKICDLNDTFFQDIEALKGADFFRERLKSGSDPLRLFAILQAEARKKCRTKLQSTLNKIPHFIFPDLLSGEQATDERIADIHASFVDKTMTIADATAGLGIDAMALARRCHHVTAMEMITEKAEALKYNAAAAGLINLTVRNIDSMKAFTGEATHYDAIFIDPARRDSNGGRVYSLSDCTPDVEQNLKLLMTRCDRLIIKMSPMLDIADTMRRLSGITQLYAIGTTTECKEIAVIVDKRADKPVEFHSVTVGNNGLSEMTFDASEMLYKPLMALPEETNSARYIAEPYPALMKLNPGGALCSRFPDLRQIAINTHLFISDTMPQQFHGKIFERIRTFQFNKRDQRLLTEEYPVLNVTCRNFPLKAPELVKRLKIKEGGDLRLFAVTASDDSRYLIIAREITFRTSEP